MARSSAESAKVSLSLFYREPDPDRWVKFDRYPRRLVRRVIRGPAQPGGMARYFLNLCAGLDRLGISYAVNRMPTRSSKPICGVIGKPSILNTRYWNFPVVFGPAGYSHPSEGPDLLSHPAINLVLVSCEWMHRMFSEVYDPRRVRVWAAGIDTYLWSPDASRPKTNDVLVYDKVRWDRNSYERSLINPILKTLSARGYRTVTLRYGSYREEEYRAILAQSRMMIFLCEHETQGFAYLQALSAGVPIFAWDRGGYWRDPAFYPHKVQFEPVTSVPYWDARCGMKFCGFDDFEDKLSEFVDRVERGSFNPRDYIIANLTLERCAREYVDILDSVTLS